MEWYLVGYLVRCTELFAQNTGTANVFLGTVNLIMKCSNAIKTNSARYYGMYRNYETESMVFLSNCNSTDG